MLHKLFYRLLLLFLVFCSCYSLLSKYISIKLASNSLSRIPPSFSITSSSEIEDSGIESSTNSHTHISRKVFCNVELNGELIEAVGFDMDFTLAQYKTEFDLLAFVGAQQKLVSEFGYPKEVLEFEYSPDAFRRGLIIDKKDGNIIKLDRHKYPRKVFHGKRELSSEERKHCKYSQHAYTFTEPEFVMIDTLFLLVDAVLYSNIVNYKDNCPGNLSHKSYADIYNDIRRSVDMCHRDGVIKDTVMKDPSQYIIQDPALVPMLKRYRNEGKKLFLLTNSMWEYTNCVMHYLVHGNSSSSSSSISSGNSDINNSSSGSSDGESSLCPEKEVEGEVVSWESLFDVIIVGAAKPAFLTDDYLTLFRIDSSDGLLRNIEDKSNLNSVFIAGGGGRKVFQGGHWPDLQKLLAVSAGDKILYVGDHIYSDVLKSKRNLGWRTCLIIPELDYELEISLKFQHLSKRVFHLRQLQYDLDEYMDMLRQKRQLGAIVDIQLIEAEKKATELKLELRRLTDEYHAKFNSIWGPLFKAGYQDSRFAKQVADYACLYTSKASNLGFVNPNRRLRTMQAFMPHDQIAIDIEQYHTNYDI